MKESEAKQLIDLIPQAMEYRIDYDETIKRAKKAGIIEMNPLDKWEEWQKPPNQTGFLDLINFGNAMRDYLLSKLEEAKQRVGCGNNFTTFRRERYDCGYISGKENEIYICDDCIKLMREGK
jgi:hypothetical protein